MPTRTTRIVAAFAIASMAIAACSSEPQASDALQVLTQPDQIDGFVSFENGTDKSFGHFACVNADEVTLETIEPVAMEGEIEFLGSIVYRASEAYVSAVDGYPPDGLDDAFMSDFEGAVISIGCDEEDPEVKTQLLLGANRTGPGGGKIEGIRINHSEGYLEVLDYEIILCGDDYEYCESLRPEQ